MAGILAEKLAEGVFGYICEKGREKAASFLENKQEEQELNAAIQAFLDGFCEEKLSHLSLDEEFDFGGFSAFLLSKQERLEEYFYAEVGGQDAVLEVLRSEALAYAQPRGQSGRRLVLGCLDAILATIKNVLLNRVDRKDWFLAARTGEQLRQAVEKIVQAQAESIHSHIDYKGSFAELVDNVETELPEDDRAYHYRNSKIGFFGREKELDYLDEFLEDAEPFLYTVITGPGGIGKSKLLYHYVRINELDTEWKMLYPSRDVMEELYSHKNEFFYPKNLLIVVDYVGQYPENIGKWMEKVLENKHKPNKMRVILLERPNPEHEALPEWYKKLVDRRKRLGSRFFRNHFYEMELLGREVLLDLMDNIAGQEDKTLTEQNKQEIYERVCSFHHKGEGGSPLYTILTTDAFLNGIPLTSLDTNKLMEYVLDRDEEYWEATICGGDEELYRCFKEMLVYATATGGWDFTPMSEPLTEEAECLRKISRRGKSAVWQKFSQIVTEDKEGKLILKPLEPDLIGEYFALNFLRDQLADERYQERIRLFWEKLEPYSYFLIRCVDSYLYQQEFQELLDGEKTVFWNKTGNVLAAYVSAQLMMNLTAKRDATLCAKSVKMLKKLSEEYAGSEEIALEYAEGLVNLVARQDATAGVESVKALRKLSEKYTGNEAIALEYAKGMFNLSNGQDLSGCKESVERLEELSRQCTENEEIVLVYAQGLTNLTARQDVVAGAESAERLRKLSERYAGNEAIVLEYAKGMFNLSHKQDLSGCNASVMCLEELSERYAGNEKIVLMYAQGLVNLICVQDLKGCKKSVERLGELSEQYVGNEAIALEYAQGLFNLIIKQDSIADIEKVKTLRKLSEQYTGNEAIALEYAKGLKNLIAKQDAAAGVESVQTLRELSEKHAGNERIALTYTQGDVILCMEEDDIVPVVENVRSTYLVWQENPKVAKQQVDEEPDSRSKNLKLYLLERSDLIPPFMEWLLKPFQ